MWSQICSSSKHSVGNWWNMQTKVSQADSHNIRYPLYWHYFLRMDNHPTGWPLLYETPIGMICLYRKIMTNNWFFPSCQPDVHAVKRALMRKEADERDEREDYRMAAATSFPEWAYVGCKSLITSTNTGLRKAMQITTFRACYTVLHFKLELLWIQALRVN